MSDKIIEKGSWPTTSLPTGWEWWEFGRVFENVTDSARKLQQTEYLPAGKYPIIDQGAEFIGGFTDDRELVLTQKPPYIVFGDHTRCVKYVDYPFVQGADGVKVLSPTGVYPKYAYYALKAIKLPDKGYSRHYKFLRASEFPIAPPDQQRRIVDHIEELFSSLDAGVAALERARANLKRYRASILKAAVEGRLTAEWRKAHPDVEPASELLKRILAERRQKWTGRGKYKEPTAPDLTNLPELPKCWIWATIDQLSNVVRGASPRPAGDPKYFDGSIPWITVGTITKDKKVYLQIVPETLTEAGRERSRLIEPHTLLLTNSGATLGVPKITLIGGCINDGVAALLDVSYPLKLYLHYFLHTQTELLRGVNQGAAQPNLNTGIIKALNVPLPPHAELERIIGEIERQLSVVEEQENIVLANLQRTIHLRQSILQKAFEGNLVERNRVTATVGKRL